MLKTELTLPELGLLAGTRGLLGAGLGLLLADRLNPEQRRSIAWTLIAVGALTTIPLAMIVFGSRRRVEART
jgi:EamA domain-containing membrane protein RarD